MSDSKSRALLPSALRKEGDDFLLIDWNDGHTSRYSWQHLRTNCPCAGCREEDDAPPNPLRVLSPKELIPLKPVQLSPMGHYAYKITWSDGHDSGIYTLENLRNLCQCDDCKASKN